MTKDQIKNAYSVMIELEKKCTASNHNSIVVVKNILANKLMLMELHNNE